MDDWGKEKKFVPSSELEGGPDLPPGGRADSARDWTQKKFVPSSDLDARARDDGPVVGRSDGVKERHTLGRLAPHGRPLPVHAASP